MLLQRTVCSLLLLFAGCGACDPDVPKEPSVLAKCRVVPNRSLRRTSGGEATLRYFCSASVPFRKGAPTHAIEINVEGATSMRIETATFRVRCGAQVWAAPVFPELKGPSRHVFCFEPAAVPVDCKAQGSLKMSVVSGTTPRIQVLPSPVSREESCGWGAMSAQGSPFVVDRASQTNTAGLARAVKRARALVLSSQLAVHGFPSVNIDLSADQLWALDPYSDPTWRLYFLALEPVLDLLAAYRVTGERVYLDVAVQWTLKFAEDNPLGRLRTDKTILKYLWYDHGVALRLEHLIELWRVGHDSIEPAAAARLLALMRGHAELLATETFYAHNQPTRWHNHGLLQDKALFQYCAAISTATDCHDWQVLAVDRMAEQFDHLTTSDGVHVEHSPSYHLLVMQLMQSLAAQAPVERAAWSKKLEQMRLFLG